MSQRRAIIDIGSNTVRLVIYGGPARAPVVLFNEKVTARLGRAVAESGALSDRAMAQAEAALARYARLLRLNGIDQVQTVATAAARDAANGQEFLARVAALGLEPRLLSGEEEALASAHGVIGAFPGAKGVVADLGGGSLELIDIDGAHCEHGASMPLGTLRLAQLRAAGPEKFARRVQKMLAAADWSGGHSQPLYLVGGSWRALARLAMRQDDWPVDDTHGYTLTPQAAQDLARTIGMGKIKPDAPGVSAGRLATLPDAAALLGVLVREFGPSQVVFSGWGLREGLLYRQLDEAGRSEDPLIAGTIAFARASHVDAAAAHGVAQWITPIAGEPDGLRTAAAALALAGMRLEPNLRARQLQEWALAKRWLGIDAAERGMLAAALRANCGATGELPRLARIASAQQLRDAIGWGLAIRLARKFSGGAVAPLAASRLLPGKSALVLEIDAGFAPLCNDVVEKDLRLLAGWLGLEPQLRIAD